MEVLIQNNGGSPLYVPIRGGDGSIDRTIMFGEHQVTKITQEIYEKFILPSAFFKSRMEDGTIRVLNADMLGQAASEQAAQLSELAYARYVDMMKKIRSAGGLANKQFAPYLNSDGTPKLELLHANFGRNIDPEVAEQFRTRYLAEAGEGMHEDTLKLPGGVVAETGHRDVEIVTNEQNSENAEQNAAAGEGENQQPSKELVAQIARIKEMNLDDLKVCAEAMGLEFKPDATERTLRGIIIKHLKANTAKEE